MAKIEKPKHEEKAAPHKGILKTPKRRDSPICKKVNFI